MQIFILVKSLFFCFAARIWRNNKKSKKPSDHFVIGSNYGGPLDPNAEELAYYLKDNGVPFYIISDFAQDKGLPFILRGSFHAFLITLSSKAIFYTHSLSDVLPNIHKLHFLKRALKIPFEVFLQHGIIGLKASLSNHRTMEYYICSLDKTFDAMIVSSKWEKNIVANMGVDRQKLHITGLPRFDGYSPDIHNNSKQILLFFTWQSRQVTERKIRTVKESKIIAELLSSGYQLRDVRHQMYLKSDTLENRRANSQALQAMVKDCALLITDDSSVAWDVFYQYGEVVFFQSSDNWLVNFDWLNDRTCETKEELEFKISAALSRKLLPVPEFTKFQDTSNSQRVLEIVNQ